MPVDSQVIIPANLRQHFNAILKVGRLANVAVPDFASSVFSLALQNINTIAEYDSAVVAKALALELVGVVEETTRASVAG